MDLRRFAAVAVLPCLLLTAAEADAQRRRSSVEPPILFELRPYQPPLATDQRVRDDGPPPVRSNGLLARLAITEDADIAVGRFGVGTIARPRTNTERPRMMERENRNIAGAGMRLRF